MKSGQAAAAKEYSLFAVKQLVNGFRNKLCCVDWRNTSAGCLSFRIGLVVLLDMSPYSLSCRFTLLFQTPLVIGRRNEYFCISIITQPGIVSRCSVALLKSMPSLFRYSSRIVSVGRLIAHSVIVTQHIAYTPRSSPSPL